MKKEKGEQKKERKNKGNKKQKKEKSGSGRSQASKFCVSATVAKEGNATPIGQQILLLSVSLMWPQAVQGCFAANAVAGSFQMRMETKPRLRFKIPEAK